MYFIRNHKNASKINGEPLLILWFGVYDGLLLGRFYNKEHEQLTLTYTIQHQLDIDIFSVSASGGVCSLTLSQNTLI